MTGGLLYMRVKLVIDNKNVESALKLHGLDEWFDLNDPPPSVFVQRAVKGTDIIPKIPLCSNLKTAKEECRKLNMVHILLQAESASDDRLLGTRDNIFITLHHSLEDIAGAGSKSTQFFSVKSSVILDGRDGDNFIIEDELKRLDTRIWGSILYED